jgi:hypothetical protein
MKLSRRLSRLVGHEIIAFTTLDTTEEGRDVPPGRLEEVGEDYIVIRTESVEEGGYAGEGAQWFVSLSRVINVIHQSDCKLCAVEDASKLRSGKGRSQS